MILHADQCYYKLVVVLNVRIAIQLFWLQLLNSCIVYGNLVQRNPYFTDARSLIMFVDLKAPCNEL